MWALSFWARPTWMNLLWDLPRKIALTKSPKIQWTLRACQEDHRAEALRLWLRAKPCGRWELIQAVQFVSLLLFAAWWDSSQLMDAFRVLALSQWHQALIRLGQ